MAFAIFLFKLILTTINMRKYAGKIFDLNGKPRTATSIDRIEGVKYIMKY